MKHILIAALLLAALPAYAENLVVDSNACANVMRYQSEDSAEYKPGVDVDGQAVESADANPNPVPLPKTISVPIAIDLAQTNPPLTGGVPVGRLELEAQIGKAEIDTKTGDVYYNGQKISETSEAQLRAECEKMLKKK